MTDTIIAYRTNGGPVDFVINDNGEVALFPHRDAAVAYALENKLFQSGHADYQIVELDEL